MSATTFWNDRAEEYAARPVELPDAFDRKTEITKGLLTPSSTVLDVGCGTGSFALRLAPHVAQVHGLDFSREMIRIARGKAQGVDNVTFHLGALDDDLPFSPGSLDMVCAYSILHLVEDRRATLSRLFSLVKPGGHLVHSTVVLGESWVPMSAMISVLRFFGQAPFVAEVSKAELDEDLAAVGFVDITHHDVGQKKTTAFAVARRP